MSGGLLGVLGSIGGSAFTGAENGLKRGIELDLQWERSVIWAYRSGNQDALHGLFIIAEENMVEMVDAAGSLLPNILPDILGGADPMQKSRADFETWVQKWGKH